MIELPQTAASSPRQFVVTRSLFLSQLTQIKIKNCERKIKSSQNHNFDRSFAPVTPESSAVMTLDSRGILIYLRFSEYATTSWGQRAGSGDVGNRFLDLSPSKSVMWPPPPPPAELAVGQVGSPCVIHSSRGIFLFSPLLQTF